MCGRFQLELSIEDMVNFMEIIEEVNRRYNAQDLDRFAREKKDVYPGNHSLAITEEGFLEPVWGYPMEKKLIINARSETAYEKSMFKRSMSEGRCLIPANLFYEWQGEKKVKHMISTDDRHMMLGGIHQVFRNPDGKPEERFTILTMDSKDEMAKVHSRIPVIVPKGKYARYLNHETPEDEIRSILSSYPEHLIIAMDEGHSQISMF
ncbi:SOS response-associated peptidase [Youngiibacter multivorans]|uniref:Abasic site processing protein n=1 Tax=Youngiibacter multivorans TaxID=937251 RepID=A0ABS4G306_9CLOT|nr:SOS response-associated peptidase [Youngiibacter multivorans]MBP1918927.1 putative SOS response-associated peptidase YedK [Youngiibacter multivorans]